MRNALTGEERSVPRRETGRNGYQAQLVKKLRGLFPNCMILKNDPNHLQGVPDLLVLWRDRWAALECKGHGKAGEQPNQPYYIELMNTMSFAAFIHPENEDEVLSALKRAWGSRRTTRVPVSQ